MREKPSADALVLFDGENADQYKDGQLTECPIGGRLLNELGTNLPKAGYLGLQRTSKCKGEALESPWHPRL